MPTLSSILHKLDSSKTLKQFHQSLTQLITHNLFHHPLAFSRFIKKLCNDLQSIPDALTLFDHLISPDAFACNTIMRSYVNSDNFDNALQFYYGRMLSRGVQLNHYSFPILFKCFAERKRVGEGEKVHGSVVRYGMEGDLFVRNAMIRFYSGGGRVWDARKVFDEGSVRDLVSWNTMIDGYVKCGMVGVARELFEGMRERDVFSWNSMVSGYVGVGDMEEARALFVGMGVRDVVSWNCMVDGYARVGDVSRAGDFFERMPERNAVSWNVMLALYVRCKKYGECLKLFERMIREGEVMPNEASFVSVLTACANLGRLDIGKWIHSYINDYNLKCDILLSTALLTMYTKCGAMDLASSVFDEMSQRSVVSWNAMIMGYGMHGQAEKALELIKRMQKDCVGPNDATFVCLLSACNHAGLILEGWWCFDLMFRVYNIEPKVEHYGCMVDLLARAGLMKESEELIKKIPMDAGPAFWGPILSSCWTHSHMEFGEMVAKRLMDLEPQDIGPYVLLSNIYAAEGKWEDVEKLRKKMKEKNLQKFNGSSLVYLGKLESEPFTNTVSSHKKHVVYSMLTDMGAHMKVFCRGSGGI